MAPLRSISDVRELAHPDRKPTLEEALTHAAWVLLVHLGEPPHIFPLPTSGEVLVGRHDGCAVCIDEATISRRHARIVVNDRSVTVEDLGSKNGTCVDGVAIAPGFVHRVGPGAVITFGSVDARVRPFSSPRPGRLVDPARETDPYRSFSSALGWPDGPVVAEPAMIDLYARIAQIGGNDLAVLVVGETGVGKELVAEAVHRCSPRCDQTFVTLNCAALPETMIEAELFGYERGAFTGAHASKPGLIESAHGGTLFLDEIGELSPTMQAKLLRALEKGEVRRLGSVSSRIVDVRFVAATNRDLARMVEDGSFRRDLYFRLSGMVVRVPPLRERPRDVAALARHFLARAAAKAKRITPELSDVSLDALRSYAWPGNVRELRAVMERAFALSRTSTIRVEHLQTGEGQPLVPHASEEAPSTSLAAWMRSRLAAEERECIVEALRRTNGHQGEAARLLGMSRRGLINKLEQLGIERPRKGKGSGESGEGPATTE